VLSRHAAKFSYEKSLFVRMQENNPKSVHLLSIQYRMHPAISVFPSREFYNSGLNDGEGMAELRKQPWHDSSVFGPYRFFNVAGSESRQKTSLINQEEARVALSLFARITADFPEINFDGRIGIVTPYRQQLGELKRIFQQRYGPAILTGVEFNTVDAFQGRERDIIIFSCVRAAEEGGVGFLSDIRRMNVGLTRSKASLFILGNSNFLVRNHMWKRLIEDAQTREMFTQNVRGLFDRSTRTSQRPAGLPMPPPQKLIMPSAPSNGGQVGDSVWDPMDIDTEPTPETKAPARQQEMQGSRQDQGKQNQRTQSGNHKKDATCHNCGLKGHKRRECPNGRRNSKPQTPNMGSPAAQHSPAAKQSPVAQQPLKRPADFDEGVGAPPAKRVQAMAGNMPVSPADNSGNSASGNVSFSFHEQQITFTDPPQSPGNAPPAAAPKPKGVVQRKSGPSDMFIRKKPRRPPGGGRP
jgi:senataxin